MADASDAAEVKSPDKGAEAPEAPTNRQKSARRRTKTGCLTCRRRRIKCGEEQPICHNCIKSKRDCEGYKHPVVFKEPNGDIRIPSGDAGHFLHTTFGPAAYPAGLPPVLPPGSTPSYSPYAYAPGAYSMPSASAGAGASATSQYMGLYGHPVQVSPSASLGQPVSPWDVSPVLASGSYDFSYAQDPNTRAFSSSHYLPELDVHSSAGVRVQVGATTASPAQVMPLAGSHNPFSTSMPPPQFLPPVSRRYDYLSNADLMLPPERQLSAQTMEHIERLKQESSSAGPNVRRYSAHGFVTQPSFDTAIPLVKKEVSPPIPLAKADEDEDEEESWNADVDMDDEQSASVDPSFDDVNTMLARYSSGDATRARTFRSFVDGPHVLAAYRPSHGVSPLQDEKAARIFCHFVSVTGPCISVFERPAPKLYSTSADGTISTSPRTLWSYYLPSIALRNPALMHAMLALSALHIAKIQCTSEGPAIKHYTYAVRRIAKLLSLPHRRHEIGTLAANLLVGFYEVMYADHSRWNVHLAGAKVLIMEFDFAGMTRTIRAMRARARANIVGRTARSYEEYVQIAGVPESLLDDKDWEINEQLVSQLTGFDEVQYDRQWQPNITRPEIRSDFSSMDIDDYKCKCDLYWWYCKQDIFQSMVSGDRLLMPYHRWIFCPPRGQLGKLHMAYATMDHLCLIMARLTDFGGKDRKRKQRVVAAQGGQWRPPPGFFGPSQPPSKSQKASPDSTKGDHNPSRAEAARATSKGGNSLQRAPSDDQATNKHGEREQSTRSPPNAGSKASEPSFFGMMPVSQEPMEMHSAFHEMNAKIHDHAFHHFEEEPLISHHQDLEAETAMALDEHAAITRAFDLFAESLGADYQPLPPSLSMSITTPFGPAMQYRTYPIACLWAFYYVGRILLHRLHPHMPPAAMVSASVTAHLTNDYSQIIGKICAGLYCPQQYSMENGTLNPTLGSSLMETTFSLLFAAVQFQHAGQRGWTICKLREISERTGWQSSAAIAAACEVAWQKLGEAGKGPPYTPTMERRNHDIRVSGVRSPSDASPQEGQDPKKPMKVRDEGPSLPGYDRDNIDRNQSTRVHWALGLLSQEIDIEKLSLTDKKDKKGG